MELLQWQAEGQNVSGDLFMPQEPINDEAILFIHGWRSDRSGYTVYAKALAEQGYPGLTFDLRGMGDSDGDINTLTRRHYLEDCIAAYDELSRRTGHEKISVVGGSFGAYMACLLTQQRPVSRLVLRVPANFPNDTFESPQIELSDALDRGEWEAEPENVGDSLALQALHKYQGKILVVESGDDQIVSHGTVQGFIDAVPAGSLTHHLIDGAPHSFRGQKDFEEEFVAALVQWFNK